MKVAGSIASVILFGLALISLAGCSQNAGDPSASNEHLHDHESHAPTASIPGQKTHSHEGWWCDEHGVPEGVCGQCSSKLAAEFQKKHDWCKEHDRPDSQCFVCHPELEAKFAAQYEAKFGKKPPKPAG